MDFKNIINLNKLEYKSRNVKLRHYNFNSSKITSNELGHKKTIF